MLTRQQWASHKTSPDLAGAQASGVAGGLVALVAVVGLLHVILD